MSEASITRVPVDLPSGGVFDLMVSSPTGKIKNMRGVLPTVLFSDEALSILDIPFVVEKLMAMYTTGLMAVGTTAQEAKHAPE